MDGENRASVCKTKFHRCGRQSRPIPSNTFRMTRDPRGNGRSERAGALSTSTLERVFQVVGEQPADPVSKLSDSHSSEGVLAGRATKMFRYV